RARWDRQGRRRAEAARPGRRSAAWWHDSPVDLGLRDKVTIVAASSKGLGRAVAEEFAREGARVVMCSRDEAAIRTAAEGVQRKTSADVQWTVADVGTAEGCQKLVKTAVDKFGTIDILISNAGGPPPGRIDALDDGDCHTA